MFGHRRAGAVGQGDRHQRERQRHGDDDEQLETADPDRRDDVLAQGYRAQIDKAVDGKRAGAVGIGDARIEPAFHHGKQSGDAQALNEAHQEPGQGRDIEQHQHGSGGGDRGQGAEGADVADGPDDPGDIDAAHGEADVVARADDADGLRRKAFLQRAQRDEGSLQPVAADENAGGGKQGNERADR